MSNNLINNINITNNIISQQNTDNYNAQSFVDGLSVTPDIVVDVMDIASSDSDLLSGVAEVLGAVCEFIGGICN